MYDALIVGAGLFGATLAYELSTRGRNVLVVDRRDHIGGNVYTETFNKIPVHMYGAHIFRTNDQSLWDWVDSKSEMIPFINSPIAKYKDEQYNLPFNMNTFHALWGVSTPEQARLKIQSQLVPCDNPKNLEEYALSLVGSDIYLKLIKGYTEKQWGRPCTELPADTMRRIPLRFTYDNNYYQNKMYQGVPKHGYTELIERLLAKSEVRLYVDGVEFVKQMHDLANKIYYTGCIDEFFNYKLGKLTYRSLKFTHETYPTDNKQGVAVVNYTSDKEPFTRTIEHKHFYSASPIDNDTSTVVTYEYPIEYSHDAEPYYPINDEVNTKRYQQYKELVKELDYNIVFCGRLGSYKYTDMEETIIEAKKLAQGETE